MRKKKAFQELVDLYEVMKGDNESRISFERYILIEYLEQIVHIANERLRKLSNGQFYLKRSERVEKRNRQSGLGLDVYDAYTGQTRDVKTLSGGEKFNASLCLALAMSDVIQAYEGGISIETMFIDEGFGSLDEESLTKSSRCTHRPAKIRAIYWCDFTRTRAEKRNASCTRSNQAEGWV